MEVQQVKKAMKQLPHKKPMKTMTADPPRFVKVPKLFLKILKDYDLFAQFELWPRPSPVPWKPPHKFMSTGVQACGGP